MGRMVEISGLGMPGLEPYAGLTNAQLRSVKQGGQSVFIAESLKVIGYALSAGCRPLSLLVNRKNLASAAGLIGRCGDIDVYVGDDAILTDITGFELSRGVLCAMERPETVRLVPGKPAAMLDGARRLAVLEGVVNPTNVGAIFRSAAALGMDAVLLAPGCCDPLHRRAVRVSMGTVFQIPWAYIGETPADWPQGGMDVLRAHGFKTAAMALTDRSVSVEDEALSREERLAVILGAEGDGLAAATIADCDYTVRIPMLHGVDSLNVAAAGAVAFWQLRKR